jgi:hypothetical protein
MYENNPMQGGVYGDKMGAFRTALTRKDPCPIFFAALFNDGLDSQRIDYALGCAALFDGVAICAAAEPQGTVPTRLPGYDLGAPLGPVKQDSCVYYRDFEKGSVACQPTYPHASPGPAARGRAWVVTS